MVEMGSPQAALGARTTSDCAHDRRSWRTETPRAARMLSSDML